MTQSRDIFDDEALWFPAHVSAGDSFLRVTRPDGAPASDDIRLAQAAGPGDPSPDDNMFSASGGDDGIGLPHRRAPGRSGGRKPPGKGGGIKASSWLWVSLWSVAAVGIVVVAARKEIAAELTQNWLKGQGVDATVKFDKLSLSHVSGNILAGDAAHPDLRIERFDADFGLNLFAGHGQPLVRLKTLHAVHPLVAVTLHNGKLRFGSLDKLIQDSLNAPPSSAPPPQSIVLDDATVLVQTDYGLVRSRGSVSMTDGQLSYLNVQLPATQFNGARGAGEISGGQVTAKAVAGNQLEVHASLDAASLDLRGARDNPLENADADHQDVHLQHVTFALDARLPYRKGVAGLAALTGAVQGTAALRAEGLQSQLAYVSGLEANLRLDGQLKSTADGSQYEGATRLLARADTVTSGNIDSRAIQLEGPAIGLRLKAGKDGLSLAASGALNGDIGMLRQDDLFIKAGHLSVSALSLTADDAGSQADFKGAITLNRAAAGDVSLDAARVAFSGNAHSDSDTSQWSANIDSDISSDQGQYKGLAALAAARRKPANAPTAPKDQPRDQIVALDRAFQRFSLRVKGLKVALMGHGATTQYDVRLHGDAGATLNGGGKVTLTPAPQKPLISTNEPGAFTLALSGPDLPRATLDVTKIGYTDKRNPFSLSGSYSLATEITTDPVSDASFDAHGQFATTTDGSVDVTLDAPAKVTVKSAELGDHVEAISATITQRDGAILRLSPSGWRMAGLYNGLSLTAPIEGLTLTGGQGMFDVFTQGNSDVLGMKMAMTTGDLNDALPAAQRRFNTLNLIGTLVQDTHALTGRFTAATPNFKSKSGEPTPIAAISLDNNVVTNAGSLSFHTLGLTFAPAELQPLQLSPQVQAFMSRNVSGLASFEGAFEWDKDHSTSHGVLKVTDMNFAGGMGVAQGLNGQIKFTSLAPLRTEPGQSATLSHLNAGIALDNFVVNAQFLDDHIAVEKAEVMTPGGKVTLDPTHIPFDAAQPISGALNFNGLDFGKVIAATSLSQNMTFEGTLTGRVPFAIIGGQVSFANGVVTAGGPGRISIKRTAVSDISAGGTVAAANQPAAGAAQTPFNPFQDLAFQAIEHLSYDKLDAKINSLPDKRIDVNFHIKGRFDPPQKQEAKIGIGDYLSGKWMTKPIPLPSDTPVELFLDMPLNLDPLLTDLGNSDVTTAPLAK